MTETVFYPGLSNAPGTTSGSTISPALRDCFPRVEPVAQKAVDAMLDRLTLFGMGFSWGGFESLAVPFKPRRTATIRN